MAKLLHRQRAGQRTVGRLVDVVEVLQHRRADVQRLLDVVEAVDQRLGDRRQLVRRGADRLAVVGDEALHVADDRVEVLDRLSDLVRVVGQHRGHRGQVVVELLEQIGAVVQRRHQRRQVLDGGEDVVAVVAERRNRLRQFDDGVADGGALPAQVVGGGVDECTQRAHAARLGGLQQFGEPLQLVAQVIPLDRHRGAVLRDDRAVGHGGPAGVGRGQLDGPARHQLRRQDRGLGIGGDLVLAVEPERDLGPQRLRFDLVDLAHRHAPDAHVVAGEHAVAVVEVGDHDCAGGLVGGSHRDDHARRRAPGPGWSPTRRRAASAAFVVTVGLPGAQRGAAPGGGPPGGGAAAAPGRGSSQGRATARRADRTDGRRVAGDRVGQIQRGSPPWPVRGYGIGNGGVPGWPVGGSVSCDGSKSPGPAPGRRTRH